MNINGDDTQEVFWVFIYVWQNSNTKYICFEFCNRQYESNAFYLATWCFDGKSVSFLFFFIC